MKARACWAWPLALALVFPAVAGAAEGVVISEFMAANRATLADEDGEFSDWIELHNPGTAGVNLEGWWLTDDPLVLTQWRFPATNLPPSGYLVVFASGKNRRTPGAPLHTNFKLSSSGEYLALVLPDGRTVASQFAPEFPPQATDVSYGLDSGLRLHTFLDTHAPGRLLIPTSEDDGTHWILPAFDDSGWLTATSGVGYTVGSVADLGLTNNLAGYWPFDERSGLIAGDASGFNNPGALRNFPADNSQWVAGRLGGSLRFRGAASADYVQVTNYPKSTTQLTVSAWVWADARPTWATIAKNWPGGNASHFHFGLTDAAGDLSNYIRQNNADYGLRENTPLPLGAWQHVAFVLDANSERLYRNGVVVAQTSYSGSLPAPTSVPLTIGAKMLSTGATDSYWQGLLDELALWNRALSAAEIQSLAAPGAAFTPLIATDTRAAMFRRQPACYLRIPFVVDNPLLYRRWLLHVQYNDGFVAWLNGTEIARRNAPESVAWDSSATSARAGADSLAFEVLNLAAFEPLLVPGTNLLAFQALNVAADDKDFLLVPWLDALSLGTETNAPAYFTQPTPGSENVTGTTDLGPILKDARHQPSQPRTHEALQVTVRVAPAFGLVTNVTLRYRVMYSDEVVLPMFDDGAHEDGAAGDGLYAAAIPAGAAGAGQMLRYRITAQDRVGRASRLPLFADPLGSDEYFGTVGFDPGLTTPLPVMQWFVQTPALAETDTGTRCSVFHLGELYDNVFVRIRGETARAWPKKSYKLDFNPGHHLLLRDGLARLEEINLNTTYTDKSYVRAVLAYAHFQDAGLPCPEIFHVHLRQNGLFYSVCLFTEQVDEDFLSRHRLDPKGALYKGVAGSYMDTVAGFEKKTRLTEDTADLQALVSGAALTGPAREAFLFDHLDVPGVLNFMATVAIAQNIDACNKNYYLYRDTEGTREWRFLPWDIDLTFGPNALNTDTMVSSQQDTNTPACASHPFIGARPYQLHANKYNRLLEAVVNTPRTRAMLLRRIRTLAEEYLATGYFPDRITQLVALIQADVTADRARWGANAHFAGATYSLAQATDRIRNEYLVPRLPYLTGTNIAGVGPANPAAQPPNATPIIAAVEFNPASGNQAEEYLCLTNPGPFALDLSGWRLAGAVQFTFKPGTVLAASNVLYVSPDVNAFRARAAGPRGGLALFVQGNYSGRLSARGEPVELQDPFGRPVQTFTYPGAPSEAQRYLRITELMYNPAPLAGNTNDAQAFEYVELLNLATNVTLDLAGVRFGAGLEFHFTGSAVTHLAPGQTVLVVRNLEAFTARYGSGLPVAGQFSGALENNGERLTLLDAGGEEILDFRYDNTWHPITDGLGFSLVVVDAWAEPDAWDRPSQWRASAQLEGSPAAAEPEPPALAPIVIQEALTRTDWPPPTDSIELFNPTPLEVNLGGWFLTDDFDTPKKFRIPDGIAIPALGYRVFTETDFNPVPGVPPSFALGSDGDEVWLFSGDANTNLTGYVHGFRFGAADDGVSFGRHRTSTGEDHFVAQTAVTLGADNSGPRIGPVILSEVMYRPPDLGDGTDNSGDEFIELANGSDAVAPLFDPLNPAHTWKLAGGAGYTFPTGVSLDPGAFLLLVNFDPATDTNRLAAFRARYGVPPAVPCFGPYAGKLDNAGERIEVLKPSTPQAGAVPYVLVDAVDYRDASPWPAGADGFGLSLQRRDAARYGNDPANWTAAEPTAGAPNATGAEPPTLLVSPLSQTVIASGSARLSVTASGTPPLRYQWRKNGLLLAGATNASLSLASLQPADFGDYDVLVVNGGGSIVSRAARLMVLTPAVILNQPQSVNLRGSTNDADYGFTTNQAVFRVAAYSPSPLSYQWRKDGRDLPGATGDTLVVSNVGLAQEGLYDVVTADDVGPVTSAAAALTVLVRPFIVVQPVSQAVVPGGTAVFSIAAKGHPLPLSFRWRYQGATKTNMILNERISFFVVTNASLAAAGLYTVQVTNRAGQAPLSSAAELTLLPDTDADGIPDEWETRYGLSATNSTDAGLDADGDLMSNRAEYLAGTDPTDALSYLRIDAGPAGAGAVVTFTAVSNRTYAVKFTDALSAAGWATLADVPAKPTNRIEVIADPGFSTQRFYRLVTPRLPP